MMFKSIFLRLGCGAIAVAILVGCSPTEPHSYGLTGKWEAFIAGLGTLDLTLVDNADPKANNVSGTGALIQPGRTLTYTVAGSYRVEELSLSLSDGGSADLAILGTYGPHSTSPDTISASFNSSVNPIAIKFVRR